MAARAALVIAAHDFVDPKFQQLRSPARDADALAGVLGDEAVGAFEVETLVNESSGTVQRKLERFFSGRKPDDLLLLYFSCHGVKDPTGRLYFVSTNTEFDLLRSTGISASFVSEQMEYSRSKRIVVLLDCCYSGAFLKGFRARGDDAVAVEQLEGRGRAVITASRATEYAFEADQLSSGNAQPSLFTGAIVEGLVTGRADANGDGLVTVDELYDYVYEAVRGKVAGQTPGRWIDVEGDLVVARNPSPPVTVAALPAEILRALESDMAMQRLGAAYELQRWYQSPDEARQQAAAPVLDRLRSDYDARILAVATATLGAPPGPPPGAGPSAPDVAVAHRAIPAVAPPQPAPPQPPPPQPPPPQTARHSSVSPGPGPPSAGVPAPPPRRVSPAPEAFKPSPAAVLPGGAAPAPALPVPPGDRAPLGGDADGRALVRDRGSRAAGWLAGLGGLALLVSPFPSYMVFSDYAEVLSDREWYAFGALLLSAVAAAAATWLLVKDRPPAVALAALLGLLPFGAGWAALEVAVAVKESSKGGNPGAGWYLTEVGFTLWIAAGVLAGQRLRRQMSTISTSRSAPVTAGSTRVIAVVAVPIGMVSAFGWASWRGLVELGRYGPVHSLILRTSFIVLALVLVWPWIRQHRFGRRALGIASLLLTVVVASYLLDGSVRGGDDWIFEIAFTVFAVSAIVIPPLAAAFAKGWAGVGLLSAWTAATAAWLPAMLSGGDDAWLLGIGTLGAAALAAVLAQSAPRTQRVGRPART